MPLRHLHVVQRRVATTASTSRKRLDLRDVQHLEAMEKPGLIMIYHDLIHWETDSNIELYIQLGDFKAYKLGLATQMVVCETFWDMI